ncbi:hypothetical protein ACHAQH_008491 [Verticillium albo-atrum]
MVDAEPHMPPAHVGTDDRRNWDMGLHRGLTRLDLRSNNVTPPRDSAGAWANEVNQAVQAQAEQVRVNPPTVRFELGTPPSQSNAGALGRNHQYTMSAPMIATPRDTKRHGWYHGPLAQQTHGEPVRGPRVDRMEHPNMTAFSGFPGREPSRELQSQPQPHPQQPGSERTAENSSRFDALVAVAASEGSTATAY